MSDWALVIGSGYLLWYGGMRRVGMIRRRKRGDVRLESRYDCNDHGRCILVRGAVVLVILEPPRIQAPVSNYTLLKAVKARLGARRCGERNTYCSQVERALLVYAVRASA